VPIAAAYDESTVEIEGGSEELREFSRQIAERCESSWIPLRDVEFPGERGPRRANAISIMVAAGLVRVSQSEGQIILSGSKEKLLLLAENIGGLANQVRSGKPTKVRDHAHFEYCPGHFYLAEGALPLVVTKVATRQDV